MRAEVLRAAELRRELRCELRRELCAADDQLRGPDDQLRCPGHVRLATQTALPTLTGEWAAGQRLPTFQSA